MGRTTVLTAAEKKSIRNELINKGVIDKPEEYEANLTGKNLSDYQKWHAQYDATFKQNQAVSNSRLQKKCTNRCHRLAAQCLKEIADNKMVFTDEGVLPIVDKYEKQWLSFLQIKRVNLTDEVKNMFVELLYSFQQNELKKAAEEIKLEINKEQFNKAKKEVLVKIAGELKIEGASKMLKTDLKKALEDHPLSLFV